MFQAQLFILAPHASQFFALGGGQTVVVTTVVQVGLLGPVADCLRRRLKFVGELLGATTGSDQLDELLPVFRWICGMCSRNRELLSH